MATHATPTQQNNGKKMSDFNYPTKRPIARKDYHCDASDTIAAVWFDADIETLTEQEKADYRIAENNGFKVLKGERYVYQAGAYDGSFYTFRGIPALVDICHKYELFGE